nr:MAG TPA_asm: hypothetical protein [Caudoviricetes sp.]
METSIYQKLLYIYYLEHTTHHNYYLIPSHFPPHSPLISLSFPSHFPPHFLLVRCRFYDIVSFLVPHILPPPFHSINQQGDKSLQEPFTRTR